MRRWLIGPALALCAALLATCETAPPPIAPDDEGPRTHLIQVASNGWHTAIVVPAPAHAATGLLPEAADFPGARFLEFGWGDRVYYPAEEKTIGMTLAAALAPTPAVMHMAGLASTPRGGGSSREVVTVALTEAGFLGLIEALAAEFERPAGGRAASVARGLYPGSRFYNARGSFHLLNTCNTWTARMLHAAGVAISPSGIVTADGLMARLRAALAVY
ncbi:MAG: DUF2459 domain-containing protein [Rhodospirillaceae bacterium]|nr:DUF2459 domain-containing protein [Rhodospirillaceae bacterium]